MRDLEDLKKKAKMGVLEVRTSDGRLVDLSTMTAAPAPAVAPLPNPPLDSAANDIPAGQATPQFPGGKPVQSLPEFSAEEDMEMGEDPTGPKVEIPVDFLPEVPEPEVGSRKNKPVDHRSGKKGSR